MSITRISVSSATTTNFLDDDEAKFNAVAHIVVSASPAQLMTIFPLF